MTDVVVNEEGRRIGESHPRSTIPLELVREVRRLKDRGMTYDEIADRTGILSVRTLQGICQDRKRACMPNREPAERRHGHLRRGRRK